MKPSTGGFLLGLFVGGVLTIGVSVLGFVGFGLFMSSETGLRWIGDVFVKPPRFPDPAALPNLGSVDYGWTVRSLDGEEVRLSSFEGQTVFLNVWATWCGPCVMELPSIERLQRSLQETGVRFVLVSEEDASTVRAFLARKPLSVPVYVTDEVPSIFKGDIVPSTSVIAPNGTVVFRHEGVAKWDDVKCQEFLRALAAPQMSTVVSP